MRPIELIISGWGPYKEINKISFEPFQGRGIFLITGPTGAGKTSIFDAICFALYGNMSGEMREKGSVRSDFADSETKTYVELVMEHSGNEYRIVRNPEYQRQKKRKTGKSEFTKEKENAILYLPDGKIIEGSMEVTKKMQEILVLDYPQFKQISMIAQGEFTKLLTASSKDKIAILREIFDTGIYERFGTALKQRSRHLFDRGTEIRHKLEEAIGSLPLQEEEFAALTEGTNVNYEGIYQFLGKAEKEYKEKQGKRQQEYEKIESKMASLTGEISKGKEVIRQFAILEEAKVRLEEQIASKELVERQEQELEASVKAGSLEGAYVELINLETRITQVIHSQKETLAKIQEHEKESQYLLPTFCERMNIQKGMEQAEACAQRETAISNLILARKKAQAELSQLQDTYLKEESISQEARNEYKEADICYKRAAVGIAAKLLQPGKPCPVCGSREHPNKAQIDEKIPDESTLKKLQQKAEEAEERLTQMFIQTTGKKIELESLSKQIREEQYVLSKEYELLSAFANTHKEFLELPVQEAKNLLNSKVERYQLLLGLLSEQRDQMERLTKEEKQVSEDLTNKKNQWSMELKKHGFVNQEHYLANVKTLEERQNLEKSIRDFREQYHANEELVSQLSQNLVKVEYPQIENLESALETNKVKKDELLIQQKDIHTMLSQIQNVKKSMKEKLAALEKINQEYGYVKDLDNMANGVNARRLVFEQFVLASYFEEILRAANLRFSKMSGGRYEMSRPEKISDGRTKDSLEIQVLDCYTGKYRSVKTLSGGESFKASLSLALGMSDVIQSFHGGIRIDTLFVDEGFGALDSESLDQACQALFSLVEKDRLIGIISHVPELRERIQCQLEIHKTNSGSTIKTMI